MGIAQNDFYQVEAISGGKDQTLVLLKSGELFGWGGAGSGRTAPPNQDICSNKSPDTDAVYVGPPSNYSNIAAGYGVSVGVSDQQPCIWGFCQIGIAGKDAWSESPTLIKGISNIKKAAAGQFIFAAIDHTGGVYTWGLNVDSALGRVGAQTNASPDLVTGMPPLHACPVYRKPGLCVGQ